MPRLHFMGFRRRTETLLKPKKCVIKIAISQQLMKIGKPGKTSDSDPRPSGYAKYTGAAMILTGIHWDGKADELIKELAKGRGSTPMALALWYWLYCHTNRRAYAEKVTEAAGLDPKVFDHHFRIDPDDELSVILRRSVEPQGDIGPLVDAKMLGQFLDTFLIERQTDPCLLILLSEMEKILEPTTALRGGQTASLRSVLNQSPWLDPEGVDTSNPTLWTYGGQPFMLPYQGTNYVLVRDDGARIATNSLHRMHSWLISIWQLHHTGTIPSDRLDLILRYILMLCSYGRSRYLKFYFNDDVDKLVAVFRAAALRAKDLGLDMRDYGVLDAPYRDIAPLTGD